MSRALAVAAVLVAAATSDAAAGGLARPFNGSAASSGMGGAFAAIADDASCLISNPAGCAWVDPSALVSLDLVYAPRRYVPLQPDGTMGASQDAAAVAPAPVIGVLFRTAPDSHVTLGLDVWSPYGGTLSWEKTGNPAIDASTELEFEVGLGAGWAVDDHVALGATARMGIGLFGVQATQMPADADLSATGIGLGVSAGALVKATGRLSFGIAWKSELDITTSGSGTVTLPPPINADIEHVQHWPQSMVLGVAFDASDALTVAAQLDWTGWSSFEELRIHSPNHPELDPTLLYPLDWSDSITARLGARYTHGAKLTVRGGLVFDQNAVPDTTIARQYLDGNKYGAALGAGYVLSKRLVLDLALDVVAGPVRHVPDNSADVPGQWPEQINDAPGDHSGEVYTLTSGLRIAL